MFSSARQILTRQYEGPNSSKWQSGQWLVIICGLLMVWADTEQWYRVCTYHPNTDIHYNATPPPTPLTGKQYKNKYPWKFNSCKVLVLLVLPATVHSYSHVKISIQTQLPICREVACLYVGFGSERVNMARVEISFWQLVIRHYAEPALWRCVRQTEVLCVQIAFILFRWNALY